MGLNGRTHLGLAGVINSGPLGIGLHSLGQVGNTSIVERDLAREATRAGPDTHLSHPQGKPPDPYGGAAQMGPREISQLMGLEEAEETCVPETPLVALGGGENGGT